MFTFLFLWHTIEQPAEDVVAVHASGFSGLGLGRTWKSNVTKKCHKNRRGDICLINKIYEETDELPPLL